MFRKLIPGCLSLLLLGQIAFSQKDLDRNKLEQGKRHARLNLHKEASLSGIIRKLTYHDAYEHLDGFILETSQGKAMKIEFYYLLGQTLLPHLRIGERVSVKLKGDSLLLQRMLYKSASDRQTEKELKIELKGLAHLQSINSNHGTFDLSSVDKSSLAPTQSFDIQLEVEIVKEIAGSKNSITLILANGDTINTFRTSKGKNYYSDGEVSYLRLEGHSAGAYSSNHTYYMVEPYSGLSLIPTAAELGLTKAGKRSRFLERSEKLHYVRSSKAGRGNRIIASFVDPEGDTLKTSFHAKDQIAFEDFQKRSRRNNIALHYSAGYGPFMNRLYGLEFNGRISLLNTSSDLEIEYKPQEESRPQSTSNSPTKRGTLLKYLANSKGIYSGFLLIDEEYNDTVTMRFLDIHGEALMKNFKPGDKIEVAFERMGMINLMQRYHELKQRDYKSFPNPTRIKRLNFETIDGWWSPLVDDFYPEGKSQQNRIMDYILKIAKENKELVLNENFDYLEQVYEPTDLYVDVKILGIDKEQEMTRFFMENGDTLLLKEAKGHRKGQRVSYTQSHPVMFKGQVYNDSQYHRRVLESALASKKSIDAIEPIYDDWMRLMGFKGKIGGKKGLLRIATDVGKEVMSYLEKNDLGKLSLLCNEFTFSKDVPKYYFFRALINENGERVFDTMVREAQLFEEDTVITSQVKEIVKHSDFYTYHYTTLILENGYVFSVNNRTFGSIEANALVGSEVTLKGKPFVPRQGEVLKEENFKLIQPSLLTAGNVEFKINDL